MRAPTVTTDASTVWLEDAGTLRLFATSGDDIVARLSDSPPAPAWRPALAAAASHLYYIGGNSVYDPTGQRFEQTDAVWIGRLDERGIVTEWRKGPALPKPRGTPVAVAGPERVYVIGGLAPDPTRSVLSAPILPDGGLGAWEAEPDMQDARAHPPAFVHDGNIVIVGGIQDRPHDNTCRRNEIIRSEMGSGGRLGAWRTARSYEGSRAGHALAFSSGAVFVAGGYNGGIRWTKHFDDVVSAPLLPGGALGDWTIVGRLPKAAYAQAAFVLGPGLHVLGGWFADNTVSNKAFHFPLSPSGALECSFEETPDGGG